MSQNSHEILQLEVWADSFKEGEFLLERIQNSFSSSNIEYIHGFIPTLSIIIDSQKINFIVYGYYSSWENIPEKISVLLEFGKPDGIIFDPKNNNIIFSYEETSAVPTGNQSQQRLERVWYAAHENIPFVYLLGKYGLHKDKNIRTTSIWPSYLALKLSAQYAVPSLTLLYGSDKEPENYSIGNSISHLEQIITWYLLSFANQNPSKLDLETLLTTIYCEMCSFITEKYKEISENLAGSDLLSKSDFHTYLTKRVLTKSSSKYSDDFKWKTSFASEKRKPAFDKLIHEVHALIEQQKAWQPMKGSTIRTESIEKVKAWSEKQTRHKNKIEENSQSVIETKIHPDDFLEQNSKKIITTTKKILTLIDSTDDFLDSFEKAFGSIKRNSIESILTRDIPSTLYVSSSIHSSGRAFKGDPFTGQITAFSRIFSVGLNGEKERNMIAYYPNQLYSQFFDKKFKKLDNKGVKSLESNIDLIIARDGVAINPETWGVL